MAKKTIILSPLQDYMQAREQFVKASKLETRAKLKVQRARHNFSLARAALRAEEQDMIAAPVNL